MLRYKLNILKELKDAGYSSTRLRNERLLSEATMTHLRRGVIVHPESLDTICRLLGCQPGILIEYVPDEKVR